VSAEEQPHDQQRSLYRRHRPRTFAEVVGQEPVVRTLRNAVQRDKVHHAYLFVGSRGTGKTSLAKILAACLNCQQGAGAPTIEPCGVCESCVSIARATSLDVIEMDAASNNSVDDIRELRESVSFAPVSGGRKVYILDEAHMLSTAAWNAFLKTLEEPPPNTVFVLATTEANKVPPTVVDRCHRFDFQRPTVEQIASVVRRTAEAESIDIPPPAVAALARHATGSFRDALGTLEQLVTYSGANIALEDVLAVLGVADARLLEETVDAVAAGDATRALRTLEECVRQGRDAGSFASDLEVRARELLVVQTLAGVPEELSLTPEADEALRLQAERVDAATAVRLLELLGEAMEAVRAGADPRTRLELALVKAARPDVDGSTRALLARIERLERAGARGEDGARRDDGADDDVHEGPPPAARVPGAAPEQAIVEGAGPGAETAGAGDPPDAPDLESVRSVWPAVVELVRGENARLGAAIQTSRPVELDGEDLTLAFASSFLKKQAERPADRATVGEALRAVMGVRWRLSYELRDEPPAEDRQASSEHAEEEWVARFMQEFDAEEITSEEAGPGGLPALDGAGSDDRERGAEAVTSNEKGA
jgi:DNA polymerase III subunit gamma/tau